jgi:hypothetical protein
VQRGLWRIPLSGLPAGAVVSAAVLSLYQNPTVRPTPLVGIEMRRTTKAWAAQGAGASWNEYAVGHDWDNPGGDAVAEPVVSFTPPGDLVDFQSIDIDVLVLVHAALAAGTDFEVLMQHATEAGAVDDYFVVSHYNLLDFTPRLTLTYSLPGKLEAAVQEHLLGLPAVSQVLGTRIYSEHALTQPDTPYAVTSLISSQHGRHMTAGDGLADARLQISVYGRTPAERDAAAHVLREALHGKPGGTIGTAERATVIKTASLERQRGDFVEPTDGSELGLYVRHLDFRIWHVETVPSFS